MNNGTRYYTIGNLAQLLQHPVGELRAAAAKAGIEADYFVNEVEHFSFYKVGRLRDHLNQEDGEQWRN